MRSALSACNPTRVSLMETIRCPSEFTPELIVNAHRRLAWLQSRSASVHQDLLQLHPVRQDVGISDFSSVWIVYGVPSGFCLQQNTHFFNGGFDINKLAFMSVPVL